MLLTGEVLSLLSALSHVDHPPRLSLPALQYAIAHGAASVLLGSRNLTTMKRMALSLAGLGSVGAWVAAHAPDTTTVAIHKTQTPPHVPLLQRMAAHPLFVPAGSISEVDQFVLADLVAMMSME